jgi:hypothetical protein
MAEAPAVIPRIGRSARAEGVSAPRSGFDVWAPAHVGWGADGRGLGVPSSARQIHYEDTKARSGRVVIPPPNLWQ